MNKTVISQNTPIIMTTSRDIIGITLNADECRKARLARDARFDGLFFIAVRTTGIFCRPICPAIPPKEENVEYYAHSSQALTAGYRPCLRCRPDSAPGSWAWLGTETTFRRAMKMIEHGELQEHSLPELAERLGISDRYLRQLFNQQLGISPKQYAQYQQLMFAKQLLHHSDMAIADIALASGFNSVRRFNDACQKILQLTPSSIRKGRIKDSTRKTADISHSVARPDNSLIQHQLELHLRPPFNWQHLLSFYQLRAINGLEKVTKNSYQRAFILDGQPGWFLAQQTQTDRLQITFAISSLQQLNPMLQTIRRMFDLDSDLTTIEQHLQHTALASKLTSGIRIPGVWSSWEAGIRAILGQQVSVKAAITHLNNLTHTLNQRYNPTATMHHTDTIWQDCLLRFPEPEWIIRDDLSCLKMPQSRKDTLKRFARYIQEYPDKHPRHWQEIKGIGPWTIQYACIRGLSEPDHFLEGDLIIKKVMQSLPEWDSAPVSPWGSYATFQCWQYYNDQTSQSHNKTDIATNKESRKMNASTTVSKKHTSSAETRYYTRYDSPLGCLTLQTTDQGLTGLWLPIHTTQPDDLGEKKDDHPHLMTAIQQCREYFTGERLQFTVPIAAQGTLFQQKVWQALCAIPYGETWSYQQLADAIGNPKAVRAVGLANGKNPISIIVPCHRVIGKNGKLTGYAGGIEQKEKLLRLEGVLN
ncbi:methylated-DNA--[protein]-cysteine S-methyltransferase [Oceanospirillum sediminis]|nr:methylated-DNA--[protein]-cysteine S-methyltransferase [Oceanospirillum sediminis]